MILLAKEGNQPNLVKDILPDKFANLLIGKDDKGGSMVASYAKTMDNHMFNHYETYFKTRANKPEDNQKINVMDLLYYHTYGDYRMVLNEKNEISFEYQVCPFGLGTISPQKSKFAYNEDFHREATPGLYGIYRKESPDPDGFRPSFSLISGQIPTLQEELNKGSSGLRLMLPSIGTLLIMTYGYTNINKEFRKMLKIILNELESAINRHISDEFGYLEYLIEMLRPHHPALSVEEKFEDNLKMYYARDTSEAYDYIINTIIEEQTTRFSLGERVILKENVSMNKTTEELLRTITPERFDLVDFTYEVRKSDIEDKKVVYYIFDPEENVEEGEEPTTVKVPQSILASTREPDKAFTQEKGKYFAIPEPSKLVAYSNIVDKLFTLHSYVFLCQEKHNFNTGYLSSGINNSKKPEQIRKQFPNMYSPSSSGNNIDDFAKGKVNENNCFIRNLLQMRNAYTQMILKAQRNAAFDTRVFDEFYKGDLTLKEISWLAFMLSEGAKIITKQPEKINALQQLTYVAPGVEGNIDLYGEANRRTIFYNVDIPLLKDVILEYVYAFNEITVRSAYSLEGKGNQEGAIAKALWGSIKKRTTKLFESLEVIPFEFFNELFSSVNNIISRGEMIKFDPYPPNWSDTNVLAYLTVNPNELNTFLSTEEYTLRLSEYLDYLYVRYGNRPRIAAAILTALEGYRIRISTEYQKIRTEFIDMIETHNKKSQLKGTDITFTAYLLAIAIMKAEAETPLIHREDYIAEGYEREQLRDILNARRYEDRFKIAAAPKGHPLYRELPTLAPSPPGPELEPEEEPEGEPEGEPEEEPEELEEPEEESEGELTVILATGTPSTGAYQSLPMINPVTTRGTPLTATTSFIEFTNQIMNHAPDFPLGGKAPPHPIYENVDGMLISADEFSKTVDLWKTETSATYPKVKPSEEPVFVKADINLPKGYKLYVVGDVHCGIHTLTNFLVNNLKVKNDWTLPPYTKVAFCGDYVDRGPYGIEVLYTVLKLQAANPDSVFLCKGNHEDYKTFDSYGLVDEVTNQFDTTFKEPFDKVVEDLTVVTGSLPSALFISIQGKGMVQLCHGGIVHTGHEDHAKLKEYVQNKDNYGLITPKNRTHPLKWADFTQDDDYIGKIRGIDNNIFGIKQVEEYCESLGLVGIISGHQDTDRHQIFTDVGTTIALKVDMGVPTNTGPEFYLPQDTEEPLTFKPRVRSVVTSMAFPVRKDIEFPAWVEIRN